ncbi:MAG: T9SS type A sorting domain-containing protein [Flavobacteriales bacterium]|nr:T9SS type A sorting domain-containing protein [Flavobacteriales bacterium]MCB9198457.1 T9SS type A sorting domain-containing protein [Flavobacteriales bacterium]
MRMRLSYTIGIVLLGTISAFAQNNALVINDNAFLVINGGTSGDEAVLVVNQSNANGIVTQGTGGNIVTFGEFDYVKWNVQTGTGAYTVPFTTDVAAVKIPLTVNLTSAGTGTGYMAMSTWDVSTGAGQYDNTPWASEVTHMAGANGSADNSEYAVDRFWVIDVDDPLGTGETYSALPVKSIDFSYNTALAEVADGNALSLGNLGGQYFNPVGELWHGAGAGGSASGIWGIDNGTGLVSGVTPPSWYRTWTLADYMSPLPVELNFFEADCREKGVVVSWQTASEQNSSHFEIYKSFDGVEFTLVGSIPSAGNSTNNIDYSFVDESVNVADVIYKLVQYDNDGTSVEMAITTEGACIGDAGISVYGDMNGDVVVTWNASEAGDYEIVLLDALGKQVSGASLVNIVNGFNQFELKYDQLAFGSYLLQISNGERFFVKKMVIK